jgi:(S)-mandelate dehydrogenase
VTTVASLDGVQSVHDLRALAKRRLPQAVFDFLEGGAEDEVTLRANRSQFEHWALIQRFPTDVSQRDPGMTLFGQPLAAPIIVAPMGMTGLARAGADLHMAKAARAKGLPFAMSMAATASIEQVGELDGLNRWFQLYPVRDEAYAHSLIDRAAAAGFSALVVTVDCPVGSKRERDRRNGLTLPIKVTPRNALDVGRRWGWAWDILRHGAPRLANLPQQQFTNTAMGAAYMARQINPAVTWADIDRIRARWRGPLIVKGLMSPLDAAAALDHGADAVVLSNHGGRQLDGAMTPLAALPAVVEAVAGRAPVLCDSGFRRGSDIVKALALGADAVLVGRACLYGAAAAGEAGAERALGILIDEIDRTLAFLGLNAPSQLSPACLWDVRSERNGAAGRSQP